MSTLFRIADQVALRCLERKKVLPLSEIKTMAKRARAPIDFAARFEGEMSPGDAPRIIAEVKLASPSEGPIAPKANPVVVAREYLQAGATALSILTEEDFFKGNHDFLSSIRRDQPQAPLLMKDFVTDEYQIYEARATGADAVLLIVALLSDEKLARLHAASLEIGLTPLVEVHDVTELERAAKLPLQLLGVNNRDLKTMKISLDISLKLAAHARTLGLRAPLISESGLRTPADILALQKVGYAGFLIGTSFMKSGTPGNALSDLLASVRKGGSA